MDPQLQAAMQLLQEAQQVLAMQAEEIQALRQQVQKPAEKEGLQKKASINSTKLATILGMREEDIPEFVKIANEDEIKDFMSSVEMRARQTTIGKIAEINDGSQADNPADQLEAALSNLVGN